MLRILPPRIDVDEEQRIQPGRGHRFEGIAFSPDGSLLAVATSESNLVLLYRHANGRVAEEPFAMVGGRGARLVYPHDVAFSPAGDLLAVAQRKGAITVYPRCGEGFASDPAFVIRGARTRLNFSDGVAFVPPDGSMLAVCNLESDSISFYRMTSRAPLAFELAPSLELKGDAIYRPDGLAFSDDGRWLAVANHGKHTVAIFERTGAGFGAEPAAVLRRSFRFPHSVAFTPRSHHLLVTNAGANYFGVFAHQGRRWSLAARRIIGPDQTFREVNARCKEEGGPKGVAVHGEVVAVCSPEQGIVIHKLSGRLDQVAWWRTFMPSFP